MSMRIDEFIDAALKRSVLKKVRIRVDPRESANFNMHLSSSYEGYILEEQDTTVTVYLINTPTGIEPVQHVQKQHVVDVKDTDASLIDKVCRIIVDMGIKKNNPVLQQIRNVNNAEFLDSYLKQLGFDDKQLLQIYKKACTLNEQAEDALTKTAKFVSSPQFKSAVDVATKTTGLVADLPKLVVGKNSIFRRMARFLRSFDLNDLIFIHKNIPASAGALKKPQKGALIYITGLKGLPLHKDKNQNLYNLIGQFQNETLDESQLHYNFTVVEPVELKSRFSQCYVDFSLFSKQKNGILSLGKVVRKKTSQEIKRVCYMAKFTDFKDFKLAHIVAEETVCPEESLAQEENKQINAFVQSIREQNIINIDKVNEAGKKYLILLAAFAATDSRLKEKITETMVMLANKKEYVETDDNNRVNQLKAEMNNQGIKIDVRQG